VGTSNDDVQRIMAKHGFVQVECFADDHGWTPVFGRDGTFHNWSVWVHEQPGGDRNVDTTNFPVRIYFDLINFNLGG
jgi:hypothetical protein